MSRLRLPDGHEEGLRAPSAKLKLSTGISAGASGAQFVAGAGSAGSDTVPKPAGAVAGDLIIIAGIQTPSNSFVTPTGFTAAHGQVTNVAMEALSFYRIADGSEASSFTWTSSINSNLGALALLYRFTLPITPVSSADAAQNGGIGQNATCPSLTGPGTHIVIGLFQGSPNADIQPPAGYTQRFENAHNWTAAAFDKTVGAGATGAITIVGPEWGAGISIMLAPT